jgi:hypothetical protein
MTNSHFLIGLFYQFPRFNTQLFSYSFENRKRNVLLSMLKGAHIRIVRRAITFNMGLGRVTSRLLGRRPGASQRLPILVPLGGSEERRTSPASAGTVDDTVPNEHPEPGNEDRLVNTNVGHFSNYCQEGLRLPSSS